MPRRLTGFSHRVANITVVSPGELTARQVMQMWLRAHPETLLAYHRLGAGIYAIADKFRVWKMGEADQDRYEEGLKILEAAMRDLATQRMKATWAKGRHAVVRVGLAPSALDPREIDPTRAIEKLKQFRLHIDEMVASKALKEWQRKGDEGRDGCGHPRLGPGLRFRPPLPRIRGLSRQDRAVVRINAARWLRSPPDPWYFAAVECPYSAVLAETRRSEEAAMLLGA